MPKAKAKATAGDLALPKIGDTFEGRRVVEVNAEREWFWTVDPKDAGDPERYGWRKHSLEALRLRGARAVGASADPPELAAVRKHAVDAAEREKRRPE